MARSEPVVYLNFANAEEEGPLQLLKDEGTNIFKTLGSLHDKRFIEVVKEDSSTVDELIDFFGRFRDRMTIFHYGGHAGGGGLHMEGGKAMAKGLAQFFADMGKLELVFLNGCSTLPQVDELMKLGVKAVIATSDPIQDERAMNFSTWFYEDLVRGKNIEEAFKFAAKSVNAKYGSDVSLEPIQYRGIVLEEKANEFPWGLYLNETRKEELKTPWTFPTQPPDDFGLPTESPKSLLDEKIKALELPAPIGPKNLINCNRETVKEEFWDKYDELEEKERRLQFYFVSADPKQMPTSFSQHMLYHYIEEERDDSDDAILYHQDETNNNFPKLDPLPLGRKLANSKNAFRKFFAERFKLPESQEFETFYEANDHLLKYDDVALFFFVNDTDWKKKKIEADGEPDYFQWLGEVFSNTPEDIPRFLIFIVFYVPNLHLEGNSSLIEELDGLVKKINETDNDAGAVHLSPLPPVDREDVKKWFRGLKAGSLDNLIEEVINTHVEVQELKYEKDAPFNMDDIELMQKTVLKIANA